MCNMSLILYKVFYIIFNLKFRNLKFMDLLFYTTLSLLHDILHRIFLSIFYIDILFYMMYNFIIFI